MPRSSLDDQQAAKRQFCCDRIFFFFVVVVVRSDKNSYSSNILCGTLEVLHRAVEIPHKDVSRQSVGSEVLAILTVLQEVFHRHG